MLSPDQLRALVSVADTTRALHQSCGDDAPSWLHDIRARAFDSAVASAITRGVTDGQINAIIDDVVAEITSLSSQPTTPA